MAKTPAAALHFIQRLVPAVTHRVKQEAQAIQEQIDQTENPSFPLQAWDWNFYAQQVRKQHYDIDENQIKPYFELNQVLQNGVFYAAQLLYGITFKERHDIPVYHTDVRVFEVFDEDGTSLALFYADYFKRDNKNGGAWMTNLVAQSTLLDAKPIVMNVANFTKPVDGYPALLSFDDVNTLFHEFGHALHGIFSNATYPTLSGTNTARDFVEFPSQLNEYWATDHQIMAHYAKHVHTGETMPPELIEKIQKAMLFNKGYDTTEVSAAALLDLNWHTLPANAALLNVDRFEAKVLKKNQVALNAVPPRYRSSYFLHIWGGGYAASYYAYLWTQMLADDAFTWFKENGGLTRANGERFRTMILARGNTEELAQLYNAWRGQAPSIESMLENRGLKNKD